jgi:hypothetical protein
VTNAFKISLIRDLLALSCMTSDTKDIKRKTPRPRLPS